MSEPAIQPQGHLGIRPDKETFLAEENPFEAMMERFDHAAQLLSLDPGRYTAGIIETLGPASDVPAPDVNTNERVMAWIMDTYSMHHRHTVTAVVTGKPVEMGGSLGRREATGRGCMFVTREALAKLGMSLKGARVAVQGFGNVGSVAADLMAKAGAIIVAVSDKSGAVHNPRGLDIPDWLKWVKEHRQLAGYPKGEPISKEALLTVECDVLVPAATENVITRKNAPQIKAKVICEIGRAHV